MLSTRERFDGFEILLATNSQRIEQIEADVLAYNAAHPAAPKNMAAEVHAWRNSAQALTAFGATWVTGGSIKTIKAVAKWGTLHPQLISHLEIPLDPTLSPFANFVANKIKGLEEIHGVKNMHVLLFLTWVGMLGAFNHTFELKTNFLMSGASQTGKSFIQEVLERELTIQGTVTKVSHATECAFKTTSDFMYTTMMYDEMPNKMLGMTPDGKPDGTGDPFLKSLLTEQTVYVLAFHSDDDGKRVTLIDKNPLVAVVVGATNNAKHMVPEALGSRYYMRDFVDVERVGHSVPEKKQAIALAETAYRAEITAVRARHNLEHQKLQFLVCMIDNLIRVRLLEDVNMTVANQVFNHVCAFISRQGFDTSQDRHMIRLKDLARTLTIIHAAHLVFNTTLMHKDPNAPFSVAQAMKVQPFLMCTEEIAMFVASATLDMFVDTNEALPIQALVKAKCRYEVAGGAPDSIYRMRASNVPDKNYLAIQGVRANILLNETMEYVYASLPRAASAARRNQRLTLTNRHNVAKMAQNAMVGARMSAESISDVIFNLSRRKMNVLTRSELKTGPDGLPETEPDGKEPPGRRLTNAVHDVTSAVPTPMHIIELDRANSCVYILRQFVDQTFTEDYKNIGQHAITSYNHKHIRPRFIITGLPYTAASVIKDGIIAPHILRTAKFEKDPARFMMLSLPGTGVNGRSTVRAIDCDFEETTYLHYVAAKCGILDDAL